MGKVRNYRGPLLRFQKTFDSPERDRLNVRRGPNLPRQLGVTAVQKEAPKEESPAPTPKPAANDIESIKNYLATITPEAAHFYNSMTPKQLRTLWLLLDQGQNENIQNKNTAP